MGKQGKVLTSQDQAMKNITVYRLSNFLMGTITGDARVAMIGFPSVGKSTLLSTLTKTKSEAAEYAFTTLTCIPGVVEYNNARIQLLDLPGIIEGASKGKGRGKQVSTHPRVV